MFGGELSFSERPTISYQPLTGEKFSSQLMTPLDLDTISLLYYSGWSIKRILMVAVQALNGLANAPRASGPTPARAPQYEQFREAVGLLNDLQDRGALVLGRVMVEDKSHVELRIAEEATDSSEVVRLREILELDKDKTRFPLTLEAGPGGDHIDLVTRSLMSVLFYLSQGVEVSQEDENEGRVTATKTETGERFDWRAVLEDILQIHQAPHPPREPYVAVSYRGQWFYLSDTDPRSKSTYVMLLQLLALRAGAVPSVGPTLTLPVAR